MLAGALTAGVVAGLALPTVAARTQSNLVLIRSDDVVSEDLYAAGNDVRVDGVIEGDLIASAFDEIVITGRVDGSVVALASRVVVEGEVTGSVRAVTPDLRITGTVGDDVFVAAWDTRVAPEAEIGRDLLLWGWQASSLGSVGRNVEGRQHAFDLGGVVDGDVEVTSGRLAVLPSTRVAGDLVYTSDHDAAVDSSADVTGSLIHQRTLPVNVRIRAIGILVGVLSTIATLAFGLVIVWAAPTRSRQAARAVRTRPLASLGWGLAVMAVPVVVAMVAAAIVSLSPREAGIPLLVVIAPVILGLLSLLGFAALTSPVPTATALGALVGRERSVYATFVVGFVVLVLLRFVPWVGGLVTVAAVILGLGGWILSIDSDSPAASDVAD